MSQKNLLTVIPNRNDTTSYHRGFHPIWKLKRNHLPDTTLCFDTEVTIADCVKYDGAFVQRPFDPASHLQLIKMLKHANIPVWIDYDDDLFTVQKCNSAYRIYGLQQTKDSVAQIASMADVITLSTDKLVDVYSKFNKNLIVIPNAANLDVEPERKQQKPNKIIMWRGSDTHFLDLMSVSDQIKSLAEKNKDWVFVFWGYNPHWLTEYHPNCVFEGGVDIISFYRKYQQLAPAVTIVPLEDTVFNHSKSMSAWIQAIQANGVCVAPSGANWKEWERPGCLGYQTPQEFEKTVQKCIDGKVDIAGLSNQGWEYIIGEGRLTLDHTNLLRKDVIEKLFSKGTVK